MITGNTAPQPRSPRLVTVIVADVSSDARRAPVRARETRPAS
jgi:hypothetical protein